MQATLAIGRGENPPDCRIGGHDVYDGRACAAGFAASARDTRSGGRE